MPLGQIIRAVRGQYRRRESKATDQSDQSTPQIQGEKLETALPDPSERRRKPRYLSSEIVEIYVMGDNGGYLGLGVLRDISETGVGVHMEVPVEPATIVELTNEKGSLRAVARHTNASFNGFVVGFEFLDGPCLKDASSWSPLPATW